MACIAGIISQHAQLDIDSTGQMRKMLRLMRHRGPDNSVVRTLYDDRGAVGANEINLSPRRTRCTALDEAPYILFDGELFNERPEGMSDLELFKEFYDKYEQDCFSQLNGSFACAVVEKDEEVVLARDHVGARPLFFGHSNSIFYFSTEMKGLVDHVQFGIEELPPGYIYSSKKGIKAFEAFQPEVPDVGGSPGEAAEILRELLIEAVMAALRAARKSGCVWKSIQRRPTKLIELDPNPVKKTSTSVDRSAPGTLPRASATTDFTLARSSPYETPHSSSTRRRPETVWLTTLFW